MGCASLTGTTNPTAQDTAAATLRALNSVYLAASTWYAANASKFSIAEQAKIAGFMNDYQAAYKTLSDILTTFDASKQTSVTTWITTITAIVFDIVSLLRAVGVLGISNIQIRTGLSAQIPQDVKIHMLLTMRDEFTKASK